MPNHASPTISRSPSTPALINEPITYDSSIYHIINPASRKGLGMQWHQAQEKYPPARPLRIHGITKSGYPFPAGQAHRKPDIRQHRPRFAASQRGDRDLPHHPEQISNAHHRLQTHQCESFLHRPPQVPQAPPSPSNNSPCPPLLQ